MDILWGPDCLCFLCSCVPQRDIATQVRTTFGSSCILMMCLRYSMSCAIPFFLMFMNPKIDTKRRDMGNSPDQHYMRDDQALNNEFFLLCVTGRIAESLKAEEIERWADWIRRVKQTERLDAFLVVRLNTAFASPLHALFLLYLGLPV